MNILSYLIAFLMIGFLVTIHEFGHFIVAKFFKIPVSRFSIGMGPRLLKKTYHGTEYCLSLLPIGGYVAIDGEDDPTIENGLSSQKGYKRVLVLLAGVTMNLICTIVILLGLTIFAGLPTRGIFVYETSENSHAAEYLMPLDEIVKLDDQTIQEGDIQTVSDMLSADKESIDVTVKRNGEEMTFTIPKFEQDGKKLYGISYNYSLEFIKEKHFSLSKMLITPIKETSFLFNSFISSFQMLFNGEASVQDLSGPIGIIVVTSTIVKNSVKVFFYWMALISLNLAFMNSLPIPALDGGQVFFLFLQFISEKIFKTKWNKNVLPIVNIVFLVLLMAFMLGVSFFDIQKLFFK